MRVEEIYSKLFELEFCEPAEKVTKEQEFNAILTRACEETHKPLYILKPAILKCYPRYRSERLRRELPHVPPPVRDQ